MVDIFRAENINPPTAQSVTPSNNNASADSGSKKPVDIFKNEGITPPTPKTGFLSSLGHGAESAGLHAAAGTEGAIAGGLGSLGDMAYNAVTGSHQHTLGDAAFRTMDSLNKTADQVGHVDPQGLSGKAGSMVGSIVGSAPELLLDPELYAAGQGMNSAANTIHQGGGLKQAEESGATGAGTAEVAGRAPIVGKTTAGKVASGAAVGAAAPVASHVAQHEINGKTPALPSASEELTSIALFGGNPAMGAAFRKWMVGRSTPGSDHPVKDESDAEHRLSQMHPDEAKAYAEQFVHEHSVQPQTAESPQETVARTTGAENAPEPTPEAAKQVKQEHKAREKDLRRTLSTADQAPVLQRDSIGPDGEPVASPDESTADNVQPQPATDSSGTSVPTADLAAYREIENAANDQGIQLAPERIRDAARELKRERADEEKRQQKEQQRAKRQRQPARAVEPAPTAHQVARDFSPETQAKASRIAQARRDRRESRLAGEQPGGNVPGGDYHAGGQEYGQHPTEQFTYLDPKYAHGQMVSGNRVETTNNWRTVRHNDGTVTAQQKVKLVDEPGQPEVYVDPSRMHVLERPASPRAAQDVSARSQTPQSGVGTEMPGPRTATDRMSSRSMTGEPPARPVEGDVLPRQPQDSGPAVTDQSAQPNRIADQTQPTDNANAKPNQTGRGQPEQPLPEQPEQPVPEQPANEQTANEQTPRPAPDAAAAEQPAGPDEVAPEQPTPAEAKASTDRTPDPSPEDEATATQVLDSGTTLYSGVPIPEIVNLAKDVTSHVFGGTPAQRAEYAEDLGQVTEDFRAIAKHGRAPERDTRRNVLADFFRTFITDLDTDFRSLADKYDSPTLKQLPDLFHVRAGDSSGQRAAFHESHNGEVADRMTQLGHIRETIRSNRLDEKQIVRLIKNPKAPRRGKTGEVAKQLSDMLHNEVQYLRDAGVDLGEVPNGYFPRVFDEGEVASKKAAFTKAASNAYKIDGHTSDEADGMADALWESIVYGDIHRPGMSQAARNATPNFMKARIFSDKAAKELEHFRTEDIDQVLSNYFMRSTKRAELARLTVETPDGQTIHFGDNFENWEQIERQIRTEDPDTGQIMHKIRDTVAASGGVRQPGVGKSMIRASSWLRTITTLAHLGKSAFPSLGELTLAPMRATTGNIPRDMGTQLANLAGVVRDSLRTAAPGMGRGEHMQQMFDLAEDMNIIAGEGHQHIMAARFAGGDPVGRRQSKILEKFFKLNMLEQLTNYTRARASMYGQVFIRRLAHDLQRGKGAERRARALLGEMGIAREHQDEFGQWVRNLSDLPNAAELMTHGGHGKTYRAALRRFVDQTVQHPDSSVKPRYASHPFGAVAYQLQSFNYAFTTNVLMRPYRLAKSGDLSATDKALMSFGILSTVPALLGTQYAVSAIEDELYRGKGSRPLTDEATMERAVSRAGLDGILDPYIQTISGVRYHRNIVESILGPGVGTVAPLGSAGIKLALHKSKTNTADRNFWKQFYGSVVTPAGNLALTLAPQFGGAKYVGRFATIYGLPNGKDKFATLMAGPADKQSKSGENKPLPGLFQTLTGTGPTSTGGSQSGGSYWNRGGNSHSSSSNKSYWSR